MDPIEKLLWDALATEAVDRADLTGVVGATSSLEEAVDRARTVFPEWRVGQAYCNVLRVARPDLYLEMVGTDADPFYRDDKVPAFLEWLSARMG